MGQFAWAESDKMADAFLDMNIDKIIWQNDKMTKWAKWQNDIRRDLIKTNQWNENFPKFNFPSRIQIERVIFEKEQPIKVNRCTTEIYITMVHVIDCIQRNFTWHLIDACLHRKLST